MPTRHTNRDLLNNPAAGSCLRRDNARELVHRLTPPIRRRGGFGRQIKVINQTG